MPPHNCCSNYTRSQLHARTPRPRPARACRRSRPGCRCRPAPGLSRRSLPLPQRRARARRLRGDEASAAGLRGGDRTGGRKRPGARLDLLRRGHRLAERAGPDRVTRRYAALRPTLALWTERGHRLQRGHPACAGTPPPRPLAQLHSEGKVSVFPAIGYTSPNQSHFTSRHFYEIGEVQVGARTGWLGRYIDRVGDDDNPLQGLSLDGEPLADARHGSRCRSPPIERLYQVRHVDAGHGQLRRPTQMFGSFGNLGDLGYPATDPAHMTQVAPRHRADRGACASSSHPSAATPAPSPTPTPASPRELSGLAALIAAGLPLSCVTVSAPGGYDTHSDQAGLVRDQPRAAPAMPSSPSSATSRPAGSTTAC